MDDQKYIKKLETTTELQDRAIQALKLALEALERARAERGYQEQISWGAQKLQYPYNPNGGNWGGIPGTGPSSDPYYYPPPLYSSGVAGGSLLANGSVGSLTAKTVDPNANPVPLESGNYVMEYDSNGIVTALKVQ